jgi:hypothetical protein
MVGVELFEIQSEFSRNPRTSLQPQNGAHIRAAGRMRCPKSPNDFFLFCLKGRVTQRLLPILQFTSSFFYSQLLLQLVQVQIYGLHRISEYKTSAADIGNVSGAQRGTVLICTF